MVSYAVIAVGLTASAAAFFVRSEYERRHFVTERYIINSPKIRGKERNFVFLSDLHNNVFGDRNEKLLRAIDEVKPDAVLIGGDMMISNGDADLTIISRLVKALACKYPVYYGNGNHEERMRDQRDVYGGHYDEFVNMLYEAGAHYLSDKSENLGDDIRITGCNMRKRYYNHRFSIPRLPDDELKGHIGAADERRFQILLLHSPLFFDESRAWGADLTLSGHFHGGTIRLPFLGGVMTPQYQFFLPWCAGRFDKDGKTMIVSRGLGTHSINVRFNDKPQLVHVSLRSGKESL